MSKSPDSAMNRSYLHQARPAEHLEAELGRTYRDHASEIAALRKTNAELFERITELKERDLQRAIVADNAVDNGRANELEIQRLRNSDNSLREAITKLERDYAKQVKLLQASEGMIVSLQKALSDKQAALRGAKDDLSRKLAKLTDDLWAKDLEIEGIRQELKKSTEVTEAERAESRRLKDEFSRQLGELDQVSNQKIELEKLKSESAKLTAEKEALQAQKEAVEQKVLAKESELRAFQDESSRVLFEARQESMREIEAAQKAGALLRLEVDALRSESTQLKSEAVKMKSEMEELKQDLERVRKESEERLAKARDERERVLRESEARFTTIRTDYESEIASLKQALQKEIETSRRQEAERGRMEAERAARLQKLEATCLDQTRKIEQGNELIAALEQELQTTSNELHAEREKAAQTLQDALKEQKHKYSQQLADQSAQLTDLLRSREGELGAEIKRVQDEFTHVERRLAEANKRALELRSELDAQRAQHAEEFHRIEMEAESAKLEFQAKLQAQMHEEFQAQFDSILSENRTMRMKLEAFEAQNDTDRQSLKQWQEKLSFLDQYLRQTKESLKRDKGEVSRLAKLLLNELEQARNHPFKEYLDLTEMELSKLQVQASNMSPISPMRAKIEERLMQMTEHRDYLRSSLTNSLTQLEERIHSVLAITKNSNLSM